ncbi:MAG: MBL fold metallo-hydrolase [Comamonadaceae bacterium]|nr:MAG: MBL fold metallo-hydrolase [Comamonadaceae bacterium]
MTATSFASASVSRQQTARLVQLSANAWAYASDYDPNCGFIVGRDSVLAIDTRATPAMARQFIEAIRSVTPLPVRHVFLTHYHAVRVLGAAAFGPDVTVIASEGTHGWIRERGQADYESERGRFPRLFQGHEEIPGLTQPHMTFGDRLTLWLGDLEVQLLHVGRGHSRGDSVAWIPSQKVLFAGDLVENQCAVYAGDGYIQEWSSTLERLEALQPEALLPGRGAPLQDAAGARNAIAATRGFLDTLWSSVAEAHGRGLNRRQTYEAALAAMRPQYGQWPVFQHVMPFDVCRVIEELQGGGEPSIWTDARDQQLWQELNG